MSKPQEQLTVTVIGKPDYSAIPKAKIDSFVNFCMGSLDRYYHGKKEERAENKEIKTI